MELEVSPKVDRIFRKMARHDPSSFSIVRKKIKQVLINPLHYKPLRGDMRGARRVHVLGSFVIVYEISEQKVRILDFDHHDNVYG